MPRRSCQKPGFFKTLNEVDRVFPEYDYKALRENQMDIVYGISLGSSGGG